MLTVDQYCALANLKGPTVRRRLREGRLKDLPGVVRIERFGWAWLITVQPAYLLKQHQS